MPLALQNSLSIQPKEVLKSRDFVLVYENETDIRNIKIERNIFDELRLDTGGVIITAKGNECDFVSRFFTPNASILEDPVTGSAHCSLIPYWSEKLNKKEMKAMQLSSRVGKLFCVDNGNRVLISGTAKTYLVGSFWIE
jgi:predicted PhzF superfamily epimerase YddE/YHI9